MPEASAQRGSAVQVCDATEAANGTLAGTQKLKKHSNKI